jgi:TRAP transporter TAXI family solute receptor
VNELLAAREGVFLKVDDYLYEKFNKELGYTWYTLEAGTYPNQKEDVKVIGLPLVIFADKDLDATMVYNIAKTIAESKNRLLTVSGGFKDWEPEQMPNAVGIELHEGAKKFYKEKGWLK